MKRVLITYAIESERIDVNLEGVEVNYVATGIGKALAGVRTANAINALRPQLIINVGTAGTFSHNVGDILVCARFIDRDYAKAQLPGLDYNIDTSALLRSFAFVQRWPSRIEEADVAKHFVANTGDNFVTAKEMTEGDVFDMEAYAEALAAREAGVPMFSVKYVTDIIGRNSVKLWQDKLADAHEALTSYFSAREEAFSGL